MHTNTYFWFSLHFLLRLVCPTNLQAPHRVFNSSKESGLPFFETGRLSSTFVAPLLDTFIGSLTSIMLPSLSSTYSTAHLLMSFVCFNKFYCSRSYSWLLAITAFKLSCNWSHKAGCLHAACIASDANTLTWLHFILSCAPVQPNPNRSLVRLAGSPNLAYFVNRTRTKHFGISDIFKYFSTWNMCLQGRPFRIILLQLHLIVSAEFTGVYSTQKRRFRLFF